MIYGYDIEVLGNFASFTFIPLPFPNLNKYIKADLKGNRRAADDILTKHGKKVFMVFKDTNQLYPLARFIKDKVEMLVSYNGTHYDNVVLDYALFNTHLWTTHGYEACKALKIVSDAIINYDGFNFRKDYEINWCNEYKSIDLMSLHNLHKSPFRTSLKQVSIRLKWYKVMDYTPPPATEADIELYSGKFNMNIDNINKLSPFDRLVLPEHVPKLLEYNDNDVLILAPLLEYSQDELKQRLDANKKYSIQSLSDSRSALADKIMTIYYAGATGLNKWDFIRKRTFRNTIALADVISPEVYFDTPELNAVLREVKDTILVVDGESTLKHKFVFGGCKFNIATGGLHTEDNPGVYTPKDNTILIDADVASYYPAIIVQLGVKPAHMSDSYISIVSEVRTERMIAKQKGDKSTADILKIVINSGTFGKLGFKNSMMFDLQAMYTVTINGQLFLLMLAEKFYMNNIQLISANTDGIICEVPNDKLDKYYEICNQWEEELGYDLEYTKYSKYVRTNVNHYLAITTNGKIKQKGEFFTGTDISKSYNAPVIAKAVNEYFVKGTPIDSFIKNHTDIYDFCMAQKVGSQFNIHYYTIAGSKLHIEEIQKNVRYYVAVKGGTLFKQYKDSTKKISLVAGKTVVLFNNYIQLDSMKEYNIDYTYYIGRTMELINRISNIVTKDMRTNSGKMFD